MDNCVEIQRLRKSWDDPKQMWKRWGPYVSERAWGTVREDYSSNGDAWNYITHDMARSCAYRWGEDGLGAFSDRFQNLVLSFAFWNGKDAILKERLFGLNPYEGNHGEDVKECYYYLDGTPTHSYMKMLYKYPQRAFPYEQLIEENRKRSSFDKEYELELTGIFEEDRYFDILIEYAKHEEEDIVVCITITNHSSEKAMIDILPQLTFRNRWIWDRHPNPLMPCITWDEKNGALIADPTNLPKHLYNYVDDQIDTMYFYGSKTEALFTNNETNNEKIWHSSNFSPFVKDAFHRHVIGKENVCNPNKRGTKAALHYKAQEIGAGESKEYYFRFSSKPLQEPLAGCRNILEMRKKEADAFYHHIQSEITSSEDRLIQRQALAGMLWNKQFYLYDVHVWLKGDNPQAPPPQSRYLLRNNHWKHLEAKEVMSMPDKWEYPWFAAWDLAFHTVTFSLIDIDFSKQQIHTVLQHQYQHPNGQIPAYEWAFSDLNPPVQAWALWKVYQKECQIKGKGDRAFLEVCFLKLLRNFNWWVNKVDRVGNNFFEGGFLGLDNISVFDRSKPLENGGYLEQSDGTGWMGFYSLTMMRIALELSKENSGFQVMATLFLEHFFFIANAMQRKESILGERSIDMWDEEDGFFYDVIAYPNDRHEKLKVRSFVGIIPMFSIDFLDEKELNQFSSFRENFHIFMKDHPHLTKRFITKISNGGHDRYLLSMMTLSQIQKLLQKVTNPEEFYSPFGLRSLSKFHEKHPFEFEGHKVIYEPGESLERIKGGNSNWRGPIWFPTNYLFIDAIETLKNVVGSYFSFQTFDGGSMNLEQLTSDLRNRQINIFRKGIDGNRPVHGDASFYHDASWKDLILFYEHFHGDTGRGLGASHQTGWTGLVANLIQEIYSKDIDV